MRPRAAHARTLTQRMHAWQTMQNLEHVRVPHKTADEKPARSIPARPQDELCRARQVADGWRADAREAHRASFFSFLKGASTKQRREPEVSFELARYRTPAQVPVLPSALLAQRSQIRGCWAERCGANAGWGS